MLKMLRRVFLLFIITLYLSSEISRNRSSHLAHAQATTRTKKLVGNKKDVDKLKRYLGRFGYVQDYSPNPRDLLHGLKQFQAFANLQVTGVLDTPTLEQMEIPRCGLKDPVQYLNVTRRRRYNHAGSTWKKNRLTWKYDKETRDLSRYVVRQTLKRAMKMWSDKTNIDFKETNSDDADIIINFTEYQHNDPFRFDGEGGTLAHAFYPMNNKGLAGDVHFDDAEKFTADVYDPSGRDLMWVATHELGHSLGLDHTPVEGAIMYPYYTGYVKDIKLDYDDIRGIQTLYGGRSRRTTLTPTTEKITTTKRSTTMKPTTTKRPTTKRKPTKKITTTKRATTMKTTTLPPTTTKKPTTLPPITTRKPTQPRPPPTTSCPTSQLTAIWFLPTYNFYVIITEAQQLYFIKPNGEKRAGPIPAKYYFPRNRIQGRIDAAFSHDLVYDNLREYTVVFSGGNYHLYFRFAFVSGPHSIYDGRGPLRLNLPRYVRKVEAAFTWHRNGRVYLFSGIRYWKYDMITKRLDTGYPKLISGAWGGVNRNIQAAFRSDTDRRTLFFSDGMVYRINDRAVHVENGYPRNIGLDLFRCMNPNGNLSAGGSRLRVDRMPKGKHP